MPGNTSTGASGKTHLELLTAPFKRFAQMEAVDGMLLMLSTAIALAWANSAWRQSHETP